MKRILDGGDGRVLAAAVCEAAVADLYGRSVGTESPAASRFAPLSGKLLQIRRVSAIAFM
jgi:hypothetical protein